MLADAIRLQRTVVQYQTEAAHWHARAERALRAGDASLARHALARKRQLQRLASDYAHQSDEQHRAVAHLRAAVAQVEAQIGEARSMPAQVGRVRTHHDAPRRPYAALAQLDQETVNARFAQLDLDHAMNELRRTVHGK